MASIINDDDDKEKIDILNSSKSNNQEIIQQSPAKNYSPLHFFDRDEKISLSQLPDMRSLGSLSNSKNSQTNNSKLPIIIPSRKRYSDTSTVIQQRLLKSSKNSTAKTSQSIGCLPQSIGLDASSEERSRLNLLYHQNKILEQKLLYLQNKSIDQDRDQDQEIMSVSTSSSSRKRIKPITLSGPSSYPNISTKYSKIIEPSQTITKDPTSNPNTMNNHLQIINSGSGSSSISQQTTIRRQIIQRADSNQMLSKKMKCCSFCGSKDLIVSTVEQCQDCGGETKSSPQVQMEEMLRSRSKSESDGVKQILSYEKR